MADTEREAVVLNLRRVVQVVAHLLRKYSGQLNYTKLIKLIYIADRTAISRWDAPITGDRYAALANGPIVSGVYNLIKGVHPDQAMQVEWNMYFDRQGYDLVARLPNMLAVDELSVREEALLDEVDTKYHGWDFGELIKHTHEEGRFPEWSDPGTTSTPIHFEQILEALGRSREEINRILSDREAFEKDRRAAAALNSASWTTLDPRMAAMGRVLGN